MELHNQATAHGKIVVIVRSVLRRFCGQITTTEVSLMSIKFEGEPPFYLGVAELPPLR